MKYKYELTLINKPNTIVDYLSQLVPLCEHIELVGEYKEFNCLKFKVILNETWAEKGEQFYTVFVTNQIRYAWIIPYEKTLEYSNHTKLEPWNSALLSSSEDSLKRSLEKLSNSEMNTPHYWLLTIETSNHNIHFRAKSIEELLLLYNSNGLYKVFPYEQDEATMQFLIVSNSHKLPEEVINSGTKHPLPLFEKLSYKAMTYKADDLTDQILFISLKEDEIKRLLADEIKNSVCLYKDITVLRSGTFVVPNKIETIVKIMDLVRDFGIQAQIMRIHYTMECNSSIHSFHVFSSNRDIILNTELKSLNEDKTIITVVKKITRFEDVALYIGRHVEC